jgi:hypothetical protein
MKLIKNIIAVALIPVILAGGYSLFVVFIDFAGRAQSKYSAFWIGILCYAIFQVVMYKPLRTYVFGHELTHAIAGILSGAKIKKFKVGKNSGSVVLNKDNIWITLSPYFLPIYTIIVIFIYFVLGWWTDLSLYYSYFLFLIGWTIAFHIALTIYILRIGQSDLKVYGVFFSYIFILIIMILVFDILLSIIFPKEIGFSFLMSESFRNTVALYKFVLSWLPI